MVWLVLDVCGFYVVGDGGVVWLWLCVCVDVLWCLFRGEEDVDWLFFEGVFVMEGDIEYGFILKNILDVIGLFWYWYVCSIF